ncbi:hypothetical protein JCM5296_007382, partial [Sporobolomyces johnsonii]
MPPKKRVVPNAFTSNNNPRRRRTCSPVPAAIAVSPTQTLSSRTRCSRQATLAAVPTSDAEHSESESEGEWEAAEQRADEEHGRFIPADHLMDDSDLEDNGEFGQLFLAVEEGALVQRVGTREQIQQWEEEEAAQVVKSRGPYYNKALPDTASRQTKGRRAKEFAALNQKFGAGRNAQEANGASSVDAVAHSRSTPSSVVHALRTFPFTPSSSISSAALATSPTPFAIIGLLHHRTPPSSSLCHPHRTSGSEKSTASSDSDAHDPDWEDDEEADVREIELDAVIGTPAEGEVEEDVKMPWAEVVKRTQKEAGDAMAAGLRSKALLLQHLHDFANLATKGVGIVEASRRVAIAAHEGKGIALARRITPAMFRRAAESDILPRCGVALCNTAFSLSSAKRWLRKLGYRRHKIQKGLYVDGHERADVLEYRNDVFLPQMAQF